MHLADIKYYYDNSFLHLEQLSPQKAFGIAVGLYHSANENNEIYINDELVKNIYDVPNRMCKAHLIDYQYLNQTILFTNINLYDIFNYYVTEGKYGWWILSPNESNMNYDMNYDMYSFIGDDFIDGFIYGMEFNESDFRDYVVNPPFNSSGQYFDINGYDIAIYVGQQKTLSAQPYFEVFDYIGNYEKYPIQ
jgi:hypothetical protein